MTEEKYLQWLNAEPRIVKENPDKSKYCPISMVQEDLLEGYKGYTKFELIREIVVKSGLAGVGRLHYKEPVSGEWLFQDGSASIPFSKGMRLDYPALHGHVMLSCAKKIGKRFGQMLNRERDDAPVELPIIKTEKQEPSEEIKRLQMLIDESKTVDELTSFSLLAKSKKLTKCYNQKLKSLQNGN